MVIKNWKKVKTISVARWNNIDSSEVVLVEKVRNGFGANHSGATGGFIEINQVRNKKSQAIADAMRYMRSHPNG